MSRLQNGCVRPLFTIWQRSSRYALSINGDILEQASTRSSGSKRNNLKLDGGLERAFYGNWSETGVGGLLGGSVP